MIMREDVVDRLTGKKITRARIRIRSLKVDRDIKRIPDQRISGWILDDRQGIEIGAIGEFATGWYFKTAADFCNVW